MEPYAWRRIYTFCIRQPTSLHPVGSSLVIPKSPHYTGRGFPTIWRFTHTRGHNVGGDKNSVYYFYK